MSRRKISRRKFLEGTGTVLTVAAARPALARQAVAVNAAGTAIRLTVNGTPRQLVVEDRWTLAEALRDHAGLTHSFLSLAGAVRAARAAADQICTDIVEMLGEHAI